MIFYWFFFQLTNADGSKQSEIHSICTETSSYVLLQVCHKHGVMHRDLKPENFLFANNKETAAIKAIDFGLSMFFKPSMFLERTISYRLFPVAAL